MGFHRRPVDHPTARASKAARTTLGAWAAAALLLAACSSPQGSAPAGTGTPAARTFDLQGHRGARGLAPENTLAAFDRALAVGVDTLELDIGITADGVPVIAHDTKLNPNLTRGANGQWLDATGPAIHALTLADLRRYDVGRLKPGTRYAETFAQQAPRDGERIPTLDELFTRVKARADAAHVRFNIETKLTPDEPQVTPEPAAFVRALLAVIDRHGMRERVAIQSFDWRTLREVNRVAPAVATVCLTVRQNWMDNLTNGRWTAGITAGEHGNLAPRMAKAAGCRTWSPYFGDVDAGTLDEARRLGLKTVPWTVNLPTDVERLLALPIDGIITDYPDRMREAMARRGMPLPPPLR